MGGASEGCSTSDGSSMESSGGCTSRTPHVQLLRAMMSWAAESGMARSAMVCTRCATVAGTMAAAVVASGLLSGTAGAAAGARSHHTLRSKPTHSSLTCREANTLFADVAGRKILRERSALPFQLSSVGVREPRLRAHP